MENLKLISAITSDAICSHNEEPKIGHACDNKEKRIFFLTANNRLYTLYDDRFLYCSMERGTEIYCHYADIDLPSGHKIKTMEFLTEKQSLILATAHAGDGFLFEYKQSRGSPFEYKQSRVSQIDVCVKNGVRSMAPSPDEAYLAIQTGSGNILHIALDSSRRPTLIKVNPLPSKKDKKRNPTKYEFVSPIYWREDGEHFAVLLCKEQRSCKQGEIKVWKGDSGALLFSYALSKVFVGAALGWMPNGAVAATVCDRKAEQNCPMTFVLDGNELSRVSPNANAVMNGMGDISKQDGMYEAVKWSRSSDLLAAVVRGEQYDAVEIWSFSNSCWSLKQELRYSSKDKVEFMWDPQSLQLFCWTATLKITIFSFICVTAVMENSTALVIDNSNLNIFSLDVTDTSSPMPSFSVGFSSAIQDIAFFSKNSKNLLAAFLSNGSLCVKDLSDKEIWKNKSLKENCIEDTYSFADLGSGSVRHLIWLDSDILLGVSSVDPCDTNEYLLLIEVSGSEVVSINCVALMGLVIAIVLNPISKNVVFIQLSGGKIVEYAYSKSSFSTRELAEPHNTNFATSCPWLNVILVKENEHLKPKPFGLDSYGRLLFEQRILCEHCSRFLFYSSSTDQRTTHLMFTTKQDLLFILDINDVLHENPEVGYENCVCGTSKSKAGSQPIKNGDKLVGVLHGEPAAILLANQGNIEYIYPRKLVLESIVKALFEERFCDALAMASKQGIDFNVIVDYRGWRVFLQSVEKFISQVTNFDDVTKFVTSLKNENVMEKLYSDVINLDGLEDVEEGQARDFKGHDVKGKVTSVLLAIRTVLKEQVQESPGRELCILTTLAYSEPPDLEEALNRIKLIREMELSGVSNPHFPSALEALKHLLRFSNSKAVYEAALGLYDLNLARLVAVNSKQELVEFSPYGMQSDIMRYTIDLRLKRYESALKNIASAGDAYFDHCLNLMKDNPQLFSLGLQLFANSSKRRNQILEAFGDSLHSQKRFEDAANAYLRCSSLQKALQSYHACLNWRGLLSLARYRLGNGEFVQVANEVSTELLALGKAGEAAKIVFEYCGNAALGIELFVCAGEWQEAIWAASMRMQYFVSDLELRADDRARTLLDENLEGLEKVENMTRDLVSVRQRRLGLAAELQVEDSLINEFLDALSRMEVTLMERLRKMSLTTDAQQELKSLLVALLTLGLEETATNLQHAGYCYQLSQMAAVKIAEDTVSSKKLDDKYHTLDHYKQKFRSEFTRSKAFSWLSKALPPILG